MKLKKREKKEKKPNKAWIFIKKGIAIFISGIIVFSFFIMEPGLIPYAPVLLILYLILAVWFWIKIEAKPVRKFLVLLLLLYGIPTASIEMKADRFTKYTKEDHKDVLNEFLSDTVYSNREECFEHYETEMLGIRNNMALSGAAASKNYLNKVGDRKIYRTEKDQTLVIEKNGKNEYTSKNKTGEIIADSEQVFYINRDENQRLERLDLKTKQSSVVMKDGVEKFAVLGDDIIALNLKGELYRLRWKDKEQEKLADYIQGFYVGKKLFVQNSTQIVSMSYEGKNQELLEKNAALKGYEDGKVYYIYLDTKKNKSGEEYVLYEKDIDLDEDRVVKRSKTPIQNIY